MRTLRLGECRNAENDECAQLDQLALLVLDACRHFRSASVSWRKIWFDGLGHLALHRQQLFLARAERVRLVAEHALEQQLDIRPSSVGARNCSIVLAGIARISGRMKLAACAGAAGDVAIAAHHPLVVAVGLSSVVFRNAYVPSRSPAGRTSASNCKQAASISARSPSWPRNSSYPGICFSHF